MRKLISGPCVAAYVFL